MALLDRTAFANAFKIQYPDGFEELWIKKTGAFFQSLTKSTDWEGEYWQLNPIIAGIRGSNSIATAFANKSAHKDAKFSLTRARQYVIGSVENEAVAAARTKRGAIRELLTTAFDAAMQEFGLSTAFQVWGNRGGARARGSALSAARITITSVYDLVKLQKGMKLQASATDGTTGAVKPGTVEILSTDPSGPYIYCTDNVVAGIPTYAATDYLFREGDFGSCLAGVLGWIPAAAPTAGDSWFGQDRSVDVAALAGHRIDLSGALLEDALMEAIAYGASLGGVFDEAWLHPTKLGELLKSSTSKSFIAEDVKAKGFNGRELAYGWKALHIVTPLGDVRVGTDVNCPLDLLMITEHDAWHFKSLGQYPHFAKDDGRELAREANEDASEFRLRGWGNLACRRPRNVVRVTI